MGANVVLRWSQARALDVWHGFETWWTRESADVEVQRLVYYAMALTFGTIFTTAAVQLMRIQMRVPEYGWTTQKVFHLLNAIFAGGRCLSFALFSVIQNWGPVAQSAVWDVPGLIFFATYSLLVLFWAEIYRQARSLPVGHLRPIFMALNAAVLMVDASIWAFSASSRDIDPSLGPRLASGLFCLLAIIAASAFVVYGGRLYYMLRRFPVESRGRRSKLREVGWVTTISALAFATRAVGAAASALGPSALRLDQVQHPLLNALYYVVTEALPASTVLYILRKLPPRRSQLPGYQSQGVNSVADTTPATAAAYTSSPDDCDGLAEPLLQSTERADGQGDDPEVGRVPE